MKGWTVSVSKAVRGRDYHAKGTVTDTRYDPVNECSLVQVNDDWWLAKNDAENTYAVIERPEPCHYCGMDATHLGFFGEPVCDECV